MFNFKIQSNLGFSPLRGNTMHQWKLNLSWKSTPWVHSTHASPKTGTEELHFSVRVYCGKMAGWIKMPLGTQVCLGPGHIVLDGTQLPARKGHRSPHFSAHVYCGQTVAHRSNCWALVHYQFKTKQAEFGLCTGCYETRPCHWSQLHSLPSSSPRKTKTKLQKGYHIRIVTFLASDSKLLPTKSTETVHTSDKARLTSVAVWICTATKI